MLLIRNDKVEPFGFVNLERAFYLPSLRGSSQSGKGIKLDDQIGQILLLRVSPSFILKKVSPTMQLLSLVTLSLLSLISATPSFPPPKSERGYGLAPERRSWSDASKLEAERIFAANTQKKADEVASKYPVDYRSNVSDYSLWQQFHDGGPVEPIVGKTGATSIGPTNSELDKDRPVSALK